MLQQHAIERVAFCAEHQQIAGGDAACEQGVAGIGLPVISQTRPANDSTLPAAMRSAVGVSSRAARERIVSGAARARS